MTKVDVEIWVDANGELWSMNGQFDGKKRLLSVHLVCRNAPIAIISGQWITACTYFYNKTNFPSPLIENIS